jgi:lipopolysaccharide transport system permease protein
MHNRFPGTHDPLSYSIYLCAGLLTWGLSAEIISRSQSMFLQNSNLLKKSNFPRICLPIILVITSLVNFFIVFGLFLAFLIITGRFPGLIVLAMLPVLIIQLTLSIGLGVLTGTLNVFFRDIGNIMAIVLQFWFWLTPIVYPIQALSKNVTFWLAFNPMVSIICAYQDIFLRHTMPDWLTLLPTSILGAVLLFFGSLTFHTFSAELVDEL